MLATCLSPTVTVRGGSNSVWRWQTATAAATTTEGTPTPNIHTQRGMEAPKEEQALPNNQRANPGTPSPELRARNPETHLQTSMAWGWGTLGTKPRITSSSDSLVGGKGEEAGGVRGSPIKTGWWWRQALFPLQASTRGRTTDTGQSTNRGPESGV